MNNLNNPIRIASKEAIEARQSLHLSQAKVAHETDINRAYLSEFEQGKRLLDNKSIDSLRAYSEEQGWVFTNTDDSPDNMMTIVDGFVVSPELSIDDTETLIEEYYQNADKIDALEKQELERGFFGSIDEEDALQQVEPLFLLIYRQYQLQQKLQGNAQLIEDKPVPSLSDAKVVKDYVVHRREKQASKKRTTLSFIN